MSIFEIRDLYIEAGGSRTIVDFYFKVPGYPLDVGLMGLKSDKDVTRMLQMYTQLPVVVIYTEKVGDPICAISPSGNVMSTPTKKRGGRKVLPLAIEGVRVSNENITLDSNEGEGFVDNEGEEFVGNEGQGNANDEGEVNVNYEGIGFDISQFDILFEDDYSFYHTVVDPPPHTFTNEGNDTPHEDGNNEDVLSEEEVIEEEQGSDPNASDYESDDSDYVRGRTGESVDTDVSSEPTWMLEYLEGLDDDDIFAPKVVADNVDGGAEGDQTQTSNGKQPMPIEEDVEVKDGPWYSEEEDDDALGSVRGSDEDEVVKEKHIWLNGSMMHNPKLVVNMKLPSPQVFRQYLKEYNVKYGYDIKYLKNENKRIKAKCELNYLGRKFADEVRDNSDINPDVLKKKIRRKIMVNVSKWQAYRAKRKAKEEIQGDLADQYLRLWDYCETVKKHNPGSILLLRGDPYTTVPTFQRMYYRLGALKEGFLASCRPITGLDGCHLKGAYPGQLLSAVGGDVNDNIFPIAMAVVEIENKESWSWFMTKLCNDIARVEYMGGTFISYRQKGLVETFDELFSATDHRYCLRHVYSNFKQKFKDRGDLKDLFSKAASTCSLNGFNYWMDLIDKANRKVGDRETTIE
ncbi:hypothetical protein Vadar_000506 [Vaccinium darrowii]|uniref:Uncharacterized protein n=1 Tax=Vaccinium darrowii TaxID=229202 RepID=A0ACB7YK79_9ERIC|nr:hypothetical protein Vadar_000506 [Vaccinium darrowii]